MEYIRLDSYCNSVKDGTHDTPKPVEDGMPLVTSKAINNNAIDFSQTYNISIEDYQQINRRSLVQKWDILMTMIGSVGRLLLVQDEPRYAIKNIALFKIDEEVKSRWLYYYLSQKSIQDYFQAIANGTSQHFVPLKDLRSFKVLPLNDKSQRIVSILSAYDSQIENNQKRIKLLEQMAENLYKEWFVRFRFPGYETAEFEGGVPKGWTVEKLDNCVEVCYGKDHKKIEDGDIPIFGSGGLMRYGNKALFDGETVLIPRKGSLNNVMYFNGKGWTVDTMFYTKMLYPHLAKYMFYTLNSIDLASFNSGAALPSMTTDILYHFKIIKPSEVILKQFDDILCPLFKEKDYLLQQNNLLSLDRDLLLPRLMSGKLSI